MNCVIYTCHHVAPLTSGVEERGTISLSRFTRQLKWLKRLGVRFIRMTELLTWLEGKQKIPARSALLTFDDAYASFAEHAFPLLRQEQVPCTIFVIAGLIGTVSNLNEHRGGEARRHLSIDELNVLIKSNLVEIGSHCYHHFDLTTLDFQQVRFEITAAKTYLEKTFKAEIPFFAYPYGKVSDAVAAEVNRSGYKLAFTTRKMKIVSRNINRFLIPRINWGRRATLLKLYKYFLIPWSRSIG